MEYKQNAISKSVFLRLLFVYSIMLAAFPLKISAKTVGRSAWVNQEITVYLKDFESSFSNWNIKVQNPDEIYLVGQIYDENKGVGHVYRIKKYFEGDSKVDVIINNKTNHVLAIGCRKSTPKFSSETYNIFVGSNKTLSWSFDCTPPETVYNAKPEIVSFSSSNPDIVSVDESGKITGNNDGTATITATSNYGTTTTCRVSVNAVKQTGEVTPLYFHPFNKIPDGYTLRVGSTIYFNYREENFLSIRYYSDSPDVAEIHKVSDGEYKLTALSSGNSVITATLQRHG